MRSAIVILALVAAPAHAQGMNVGVGGAECAAYIEAFPKTDPTERMMVISWVQGFISGLNIASAREGNDKQMPDGDALTSKMLLLCKEHPTKPIANSAMRLWKELPARK